MIPAKLLGALALAVSASALSGCYAEAHPMVYTTSASVEATDGYEPAYYDGYVVYYDNVGEPYYYEGGRTVYVAHTSPYYIGLHEHYRTYGPAYHNWYAHRGYNYHAYRSAPGHYQYRGYVQHAPPARRR